MKKRRVKRLLILGALMLFLLAFYFYLDWGLRENLLVQGEAELNNIAISIMNTSVSEVLQKRYPARDLLKIEKDEQGRVAMVSADAAEMNQIVYECVELAQEKIRQLERDKIPIPLGNAIGSRLFSGKGPDIRIGVLPMGAVSAEYFTEFYAAGINQTRYKIYMVLKSDMALVVGRSSQSVHIESQVLIADAIIVGTVPQSYANLDGARGFIDLTP